VIAVSQLHVAHCCLASLQVAKPAKSQAHGRSDVYPLGMPSDKRHREQDPSPPASSTLLQWSSPCFQSRLLHPLGALQPKKDVVGMQGAIWLLDEMYQDVRC
jgi:hypothetical protein